MGGGQEMKSVTILISSGCDLLLAKPLGPVHQTLPHRYFTTLTSKEMDAKFPMIPLLRTLIRIQEGYEQMLLIAFWVGRIALMYPLAPML